MSGCLFGKGRLETTKTFGSDGKAMVSGLSEYDSQEFLTLLNFEDGPYKKHAAQRRNWVPNQNLF